MTIVGTAVLVILQVTSMADYYSGKPEIEYKSIEYHPGYTWDACMKEAGKVNQGNLFVGADTAACLPVIHPGTHT